MGKLHGELLFSVDSMFRVFIGNKPAKELKSFDEKTRKRIELIFETLELNPWPAKDFDLSKIAGLADCFRIRLGKYRINYHVNTERSEILVYRIEKKKDTTYKR